jgi:hypothetical protein
MKSLLVLMNHDQRMYSLTVLDLCACARECVSACVCMDILMHACIISSSSTIIRYVCSLQLHNIAQDNFAVA